MGQRKRWEERRRTVLPARVRVGTGWSDACILNISSRGLLIYAKCTPQPGSSVELRRGTQLVFARVVWRNNNRIGLCSNDPLPIEQIISSQVAAAAATATLPALPVTFQTERRKRPRDPDRSRARSKAIEFLSLVVIGAALAGGIGASVLEAFARPVTAVNKALGSR